MLYRATRGKPEGDAVYDRYRIRATPTTLIVGADGEPIDWHVGYSPPPKTHLERLRKTLDGVGTYRAAAEAYAADPDNVAVVFELARKWADRYDESKTKEFFEKVLALDPDGRGGTTDYSGEPVPYTDYAKYVLAENDLYWGERSPDKLKAFVAAHTEGEWARNAAFTLARHYVFQGNEEEAFAYLEEFVARYPEDPSALDLFVSRAVRKRENLDRGLELAKKVSQLTRFNPNPDYMLNLAQIYVLKDNPDQADEVYGQDFMASRLSNLAYDLAGYAEFWVKQERNLESAERMMDQAVALEPENLYLKQRAASLALDLGKTDKALALYGPGYLAGKEGDPSVLSRYAFYWAGKSLNLESALQSAGKAVELDPSHSNWAVLAQVLARCDRDREALDAIRKALKLAEGKDEYYIERYQGILKQIEKKLENRKK